MKSYKAVTRRKNGVVEIKSERQGKKIVVGVVGYGYWGPNLVRNYLASRRCTVKCVCDISEERLEQVADRYPVLYLTQDYDVLLNDKDLDAIIIATPISTHYSLAKQAILKKKHVFVEKPLASTSEEARELVKLADKHEVTLMVGHTFEYSPPVVKVKKLISEYELGEIYYISSSRVNLGLHQSDVSVIWDLAPHDFSIIFSWLEEEPTTVSTFGRGCIRPGVPDVAFINLRFPSGTIAQIQLSWLSPVKLRRTFVVGSKKMLLYDDTQPTEKVKVFDHGVKFADPQSFEEFQLSYRTGDVISPHLDSHEPLLIEANHFLECIVSGKKPKTDGQNGLRVVRALERAEDSLRSNGGFKEAEVWHANQFRFQNQSDFPQCLY